MDVTDFILHAWSDIHNVSWFARIEQACAAFIERTFGGIPEAEHSPATRELQLRVIHGLPVDGIFRLQHSAKKRSYTVGRSAENDIMLDDPSVSREHAAIEFDAEGAIVNDLGSTNGTFINGQRISMQRIVPSDTLNFGKTQLHVEQNAT